MCQALTLSIHYLTEFLTMRWWSYFHFAGELNWQLYTCPRSHNYQLVELGGILAHFCVFGIIGLTAAC